MRIFSIYFPLLIVSMMLNGCFFTQSPVHQWKVSDGGTTAFGLSRDGLFALSYSQKNQLELWDLSTNKLLAKLGPLDQKASTVTKIRISDNDRYAVTAGQTNFAVWDLAWTQSTGLWSISDGLIRDIDISKDGKQVLMGLSNGKAIYVNLVNGRRMEFLAHRNKVNSVALSPNGYFALTGGNDHIAYLWDTRSGQILLKFEHKQRVVRVTLQRDGKYAFTSDGGKQARIWNLKTGQEVSYLRSFSRQLIFSCARFSDDGLRLVTGTPSGRVMVWDTQSGKKQAEFATQTSKDERPPRAVVYDVSFDQHHHVISANSAGIAEVWKIK
jgi:WD40 repeat protein